MTTKESEVDVNRLDYVLAKPLDGGGHESINQGMCVMEAVSYVAGEKWSDTPECACPVIGAFMRVWNDALPDEKRTDLLRPMIPLLVGSRATPEIENRRSLMAADWLVRECTPAWLRLAGLTAQADALASLPEITDMAQIPSIRPAIDAARQASAAASAAAWDAASAAAWDAASAAAWDAASAAAWAAAASAAAWDAASAAARDAAWDAASAAASAAARAKLAPTVDQLQKSAVELVKRMLAVQDTALRNAGVKP